MSDRRYPLFEELQKERGVDIAAAWSAIRHFRVETPSWGYGDSGTRFKVFRQTGVPRNPYEKIDDAAMVHKLTGICPSVAIHIPWDKVEDYSQLASYAKSKGLKIGAVNPNLFQEDEYIFGSICNSRSSVREKAIHHLLECIDVANAVGSDILSLWFADGTNYPGQAHLRQRKHWLEESLAKVYGSLPGGMRMLIEYKFFEPGFYHTDLADWGMAYNLARKLGPQAQVLVDMGHHAPGTNVEHLVAYLLDEKVLGGFHFNSRKYADDDLIVGTIHPYELFLIFSQIVEASLDTDNSLSDGTKQIAYMIDQSHNIEPKIPAMIRSVLNIQTQFAKAQLINWRELHEAQERQDVLKAEALIREAFEQDVTPLLHAVREEMGVPIDPMKEFDASGYPVKIQERGRGGMSW